MAKNKENKQFTITLSERQLRLLAYACRVTDRLIIGQLDFSLKECCEGAFLKLHKNDGAGKVGSDMWNTMRFVVENSMALLRTPSSRVARNTNHGIYYDETADILFDMQKVIEHSLWLEKDPAKRSKWTNDAFEHKSTFGSERNIKVTKSNDNGNS